MDGTARIPIFPLGTVLFPGFVLPLHIFEERYRALMRHLVEQPDPERRSFGVVAIRHGREVGADAVEALHEVGTVARLHTIAELPDGRFEIETVGTERFRLLALDDSRPFLQADVEFLGDPPGDGPENLVPGAVAAFRRYLQALSLRRGAPIEVGELPQDPRVVSYLIAASVLVDLPVRQRLLAEPDCARRLAAETVLLRDETRLLQVTAAAPAPDLIRAPQSPN